MHTHARSRYTNVFSDDSFPIVHRRVCTSLAQDEMKRPACSGERHGKGWIQQRTKLNPHRLGLIYPGPTLCDLCSVVRPSVSNRERFLKILQESYLQGSVVWRTPKWIGGGVGIISSCRHNFAGQILFIEDFNQPPNRASFFFGRARGISC